MQRKLGGIFTIVAAVGALAASSSGVASASESSDEAHLLALVNGERAAHGLPAYAPIDDLDALARAHSRDMLRDGRIYHSPSLEDDVRGCWTTLGENVGTGPDVDSVHNAFMNSPEHRSNILDNDFNQVGLGIVVADDGRVYITETFAERRCATHKKTVRHVRAPARRTPPPRVVRAHLQHPSSVVTRAEQNVALLVRMIDLDGTGR
jgi:hypothetical protein